MCCSSLAVEYGTALVLLKCHSENCVLLRLNVQFHPVSTQSAFELDDKCKKTRRVSPAAL